MSVTSGLAAIKKMQQEQAARRAEMDRPRAKWFKAGANETRNIRFLQELDEESEAYNAEKGLTIFAVEHSPAGNEGWKFRVLCTLEEEGRCYFCELNQEDPELGLKQKTNFYANIVDEDGEIKVFSRSAYSTVVNTLTEYYDEEGNITDTGWRISKSGSGRNTQWSALPSKKMPQIKDGETIVDLRETVIRHIAYPEQQVAWEKFAGSNATESESPKSDASADDDSVDW